MGRDAPDITAGLPSDRAEWPSAVLAAVEPFRQGHIVENPPLFYFADPAHPVWAATRPYSGGSAGPEIVDAEQVRPPYGIITTQTCDIGEIGFRRPVKPWVTIAPVYDMGERMEGGQRGDVRSGNCALHWMHVPELATSDSEFFVADFRIEVPVEKSWLVGRIPIEGFSSEESRSAVGERLAILRSRPAWGEVVVENVQRTTENAMSQLKKTDKDLYRRVKSQVDEVGAKADSLLLPSTIRLGFFYLSQLDDDVREWCDSLNDLVRDRCFKAGLTVQAPKFASFEECTVAEYRTYATVPLTRFSLM